MVERLGIDHQICIAHVKKRAWSRLDKIDGRDWVKARIWRLLTDLPFDGDLDLSRMARFGTATRLFTVCAWILEGSDGRRYAAAGGGTSHGRTTRLSAR